MGTGETMKSAREAAGILATLFCLGFGAGCAQVEVTQVGDTAYPAKSGLCELPVVYEQPKTAYVEICQIKAKGGESLMDRTVARILGDVKKKACECGADVVWVKRAQEADPKDKASRAEIEASALHL